MKVLLINMSDSKGGAAIVAHRLLQALNTQPDVEAKMLVAEKRTDDASVIALPRRWWLKKALDRAVVWAANGFTKKGLWLTDCGLFGTDITRHPAFREADVVHLHWVNQGMLSLRDIDNVLHSGKRVVWTMHDMWPATAICHHAADCEHYRTTGCKACPQLRHPKRFDLSWRAWQRKMKCYETADLHLVACSSWMAEKAKASLLTRHLPISVVANPINIKVPSPYGEGRRGVVFSAARIDDEIKGFDDLLAALAHLTHRTDVELLLIGRLNDKRLLDKIPVPYRYLGYRRDVLDLYARAACVVCCSRYETLPTTLVEAQTVGTTPVAYRHSGALDLISDGETGYLARYRDPHDLARAIAQALDHPIAPERLRQHAASTYAPDVIARKYIAIYKASAT